ncbi:hypothetical protein O6H91_04G140500 [Diphasiastrum complanatum]|uniref:Uncharacterized protein n=1 Tax=Diphasiastrum complanatum TaxID=34168 RepID=A0ACC2E2D1_DIPCM|nr:hypothetical protein O6H91_04G140500 [Diphasiastrum complanatum]
MTVRMTEFEHQENGYEDLQKKQVDSIFNGRASEIEPTELQKWRLYQNDSVEQPCHIQPDLGIAYCDLQQGAHMSYYSTHNISIPNESIDYKRDPGGNRSNLHVTAQLLRPSQTCVNSIQNGTFRSMVKRNSDPLQNLTQELIRSIEPNRSDPGSGFCH